jgi:hypothetical protein
MLDLETWGTEPGCDIRSIGVCLFDPLNSYVGGHDCPVGSREYPTFYIAVDDPFTPNNDPLDPESHTWDREAQRYRKYHLTRDPRTVQWWNDQSDEAQAAFANPVDLREGLIEFAEWLQTVRGSIHQYSMSFNPSDDIRIWSHGSHFDSPILAAAYRACGLPVPWHYRAPRDTRTAFDLAGIDDHSAHLAAHPGPLGIPHHALDDAICQARAVCAAYDIIGAWRNAHEECERDL